MTDDRAAARLLPRPVLAFAGKFLDCNPARDDDGHVVFAADTPTLIGAATIRWGREDQWAQPEPAVLTFEMFDPTDHWLTRIADRTAIGQGAMMWWDRPGASPAARMIFQGFSTNVDVTAMRARTTAGLVDGWRVAVQIVDRSGYLGNQRWPNGEWPRETMLARAIRIRDWAGPLGIRHFYYDDRYKNAPVGPYEVRDATNLDLTNRLFASFGQQWAYNPLRNVVQRIARHVTTARPSFARISTADGVTITAPDLADTSGVEDAIDREPYPGAGISACDVSAELSLSASTLTDITRVECNWHDWAAGHTGNDVQTTRSVNRQPSRTLAYDSWLSDGLQVDPVIDEVWAKAQAEAAQVPHPQIRYDTRYNGGFRSYDQAESLLLPCETIRAVYLSGSPFSARIDQHPMMSPAGGTITYEAGHWIVLVDLVPIQAPAITRALTWRSWRSPAMTFGRPPGAMRFDPGVCWADMRWLDSTTIKGSEA